MNVLLIRAPGSSRKFRPTDFWRCEKSVRGRGWIFRPKKSRPDSEARRRARADLCFAVRPRRVGAGFFISRAGSGLDFLFRVPAGLGSRRYFFFGMGLDFSLLEQPAEPRSKDFLRKSGPTRKPSPSEKSSPVSEACRGGRADLFFAAGEKNPAPTRRPAGEARRIFFSPTGRAGSGLDFSFRGPGRGWVFYFAERE